MEVSFLLAMLVTATATAAAGDFELHAARVRAFACGSPQPRAVSLRDVISDDRDWLERYESFVGDIHPPATVLWRCEHSGCCRHGHACLVEDYELVELPFLNATGPVVHFVVPAENHTRCSCQKVGSNRIK